jgi:hypothetical protein
LIGRDRFAVPHAEFLRVAADEKCGTCSWQITPIAGMEVWQARLTVRELLAEKVFPVWLLGPSGGDFDHFNHPDYRRIRFSDALRRADFISECTKNRFPARVEPPSLQVLLLHCATCDHYAVIDGNHRLTRLWSGMLAPGPSAELTLTALTGTHWAPGTPDMMKICACLAHDAA